MTVLPAIAASVVLAHQGGWDETLMVLVPILVFVGLIVLANRRASAAQARRQATESAGEGTSCGPAIGEVDATAGGVETAPGGADADEVDDMAGRDATGS